MHLTIATAIYSKRAKDATLRTHPHRSQVFLGLFPWKLPFPGGITIQAFLNTVI